MLAACRAGSKVTEVLARKAGLSRRAEDDEIDSERGIFIPMLSPLNLILPARRPAARRTSIARDYS
jgi:hypothetical protein